MSGKIIVSGVGCCLVDFLFNNIDFSSDAIRPFLSQKRGDGGLVPGMLVFKEEFEKFSSMPVESFINRITGGRSPDNVNIGGPSIVSLIHVAQVVDNESCEVRFFGHGGNDEAGRFLLDALKKTPVIIQDYKLVNSQTPSTFVLSDPKYDNGHGERMFINSVGSAKDYKPHELNNRFFNSDIVVFGGTALVPGIHDHLTDLLKEAKSKGCVTIVNTVFDFRNEKHNPAKRWPLGSSDESYRYTDLLITDLEEALRLSGENDIRGAIKFFLENKVSSFIITNGSKNVTLFADGRFFNPSPVKELPVSAVVVEKLRSNGGGDTTGCGDNFAGGVIASIVTQLRDGIRSPDFQEACIQGIVSGGFACFYMGGTYFEKQNGEKRNIIKPFYESYKNQISDRTT